MDPQPPANIAVIGPGMIGGSLLLALRKHFPSSNLRAWSRGAATIEQLRIIDPAVAASTDLRSVAGSAGLIVLCTPVAAMPGIARQLAALPLEPGCVVTDVGSVKGPVVTALEQIFSGAGSAFVGSHPMAGSERAGIAAARADLFEGATCIVTPTLFTADAPLRTVRGFWTLLGCHVIDLPPDEHDRKIARISHLPHLAAIAVTLAALRPDTTAAECAGNGFRDVTRVASGDPELWAGIMSQNRAEIVAALQDAHEITGDLLAILRSGDDGRLLRILREARSLRDNACAG